MSIIAKTEEQRNELSQKLSGFCKEFDLYNLLRRFGAEKIKGIPFQTVFGFLLSLVFSGRNLYNTIRAGENSFLSKDTVYRFLNNSTFAVG
jgi:hypothetical protein